MKIAISGSTGLIGTALIDWFSKNNFQISRLVRTPSFHDLRYPCIQWNPQNKHIEKPALENHDVIIHLAGENVASGRWTDGKKEAIRKSRVEGTSFLSEVIASLKNPPKVFFSASAIGYYEHTPFSSDTRLTEDSPSGHGFLASVAGEWEKATEKVETRGIRTIHMRLGVVLSSNGGALKRMLPIFKMGMGGCVGSGEQIMSWISIHDIPRIIYYILKHEELSGPINFTAPNPVSNKVFVKTLGRILRRPTWFPLPVFAAKLLMGEMAEELLLSGATVLPRKLQESGYHFLHPTLESALRNVL